MVFWKDSHYDPSQGQSFFEHVTFRLVAVERTASGWEALSRHGEPVLLEVQAVSGFFEKVGRNTGYVLHPEETLAENFTRLVLGQNDLPSPQIIQRMERVLTPLDRTAMIPPDFAAPALLETGEFRLRPLTMADVQHDYEAVVTSAELLHAMFGSDWPRPGFTLEENLEDLAEHQQEFAQRAAFTYTVMSPDERECLGCVYIRPPAGHPVDARVYLWVRQSAHDRGMDPVLFQAVKRWLADWWPLRQVIFPGRNENPSS
jgi:hypothetical protein